MCPRSAAPLAQRIVRSTPRRFRALLLPSDIEKPCSLITVRDASTVISDIIDADVIDDLVIGAVDEGMFVIYAADAPPELLAINERAGLLMARLGYHARDVQARLRGNILVAGLARGGSQDIDVPNGVITAAFAAQIEVLRPEVRR